MEKIPITIWSIRLYIREARMYVPSATGRTKNTTPAASPSLHRNPSRSERESFLFFAEDKNMSRSDSLQRNPDIFASNMQMHKSVLETCYHKIICNGLEIPHGDLNRIHSLYGSHVAKSREGLSAYTCILCMHSYNHDREKTRLKSRAWGTNKSTNMKSTKLQTQTIRMVTSVGLWIWPGRSFRSE